MKLSRVVVSLLGFGALVLAVWLVARADWHPTMLPSGEGTVAAPDVASDAEAAAAELTRTRPRSPAHPEAPLPPVDAPLADTFDELVALADRGDPRAACRLALELQDCQNELPRLELMAQSLTADAPDTFQMETEFDLRQAEARLNYAQVHVDAHDVLRDYCSGIPEVPVDRRLGWWRQAALAGRRAPLQEFLSGASLPFHEWVRYADHLTWVRQQLEPMVWRAMQSGDLETAWHLMNALTPQPGLMRLDPLSQLVDADAEMALALAVYLEHAASRAEGDAEAVESLRIMAARTVPHLEAMLSPEQQRRAGAAARDWNRTIAPLPVTSSLFKRYHSGAESRGWLKGRMEMCGEAASGPRREEGTL